MSKTHTGGQTALATLEKKLSGANPDDTDVPAAIGKAVRYMLAGAAVTAVTGLFSIIVAVTDAPSLNHGKQPTSGWIAQAIVSIIIIALVFMAIWVLMARFNRAGQKWARIAATVLFAILTYDLYKGINSLHAGQTILVLNVISFVLVIGEWLCGLGAIALLWRSESTAYFNQRAALRR
jgi:hypothetical protein